MNDRLFRKFVDLLVSFIVIYLVSSCIFLKGYPMVSAIVASGLIIFSLIFTFAGGKFSDLDFPKTTLLADAALLFLSFGSFCLCEKEDVSIFPIMVLAFSAAILDIFRICKYCGLREKSFIEIFNSQLRLPITINLALFCIPLFQGYYDGWNTFDIYEYVFVGFLFIDLIHNLAILPSTIRAEHQAIADNLKLLEDEKGSLVCVESGNPAIDEDALKLVEDRINLIDRILIGRMSGNTAFSRRADREVERIISDRVAFIESLALHFMVSHPKATGKLRECGLSDYEIGLCCLYYMGYNGKEVKDISDTSMIYHINSAIRQKLGMKPGDVNLSTFIREIFSN